MSPAKFKGALKQGLSTGTARGIYRPTRQAPHPVLSGQGGGKDNNRMYEIFELTPQMKYHLIRMTKYWKSNRKFLKYHPRTVKIANVEYLFTNGPILYLR